MIWCREFYFTVNSGGASFAQVNVLSNLETLVGGDLVGSTLMAVRGTWSARWALAGSALSSTVDTVTAGLAVVDVGDTFTSSYANNDRFDGKWMWWDSIPIVKPGANYPAENVVRDINVRSRRVIRSPNEVLRLSVQGAETLTNSSADWAVNLSILVALP